MSKRKEEKVATFADVVKECTKEHGKEFFDDGVPSFMPTRLLRLGLYMGGGIPVGRIIEAFGPEGGFKSTLGMMLLADIRAACPGRHVVYDDKEHTYHAGYGLKQGLELQAGELIRPMTLDEGYNALIAFVRTGEVCGAMIDSIAAIATKAEIESAIEEIKVGVRAKTVTQLVYRLVGALSRGSCTCIAINQVRVEIGKMFGNPETTPGGKALRHAASVRVRCSKKEEKEARGGGEQLVTVGIVKNKLTGRNAVLQYRAVAGEGFDLRDEFLLYLVELGIVKQQGTSYQIGKNSVRGRLKAAEVVNKNADKLGPLAVEQAQKLIESWRNSRPDTVAREDTEEVEKESAS